MSRISDFDEKFLYTPVNPENIIPSPYGGWFYRRHRRFYLNTTGDVNSNDWVELPYKTVILPRWPANRLIEYEYESELWFKTTDGFVDEYGVLHSKVGWVFYAYNVDVFFRERQQFSWIFPPPSSSLDPTGVDNNRSYDQNYFYAKISGSWYRTPIAEFTDATPDDPGEVPYWYNNLPFVDAPRKFPRPISIDDTGIIGQQSYDYDYFYIDVSVWKRCPLVVFLPPHSMASF